MIFEIKQPVAIKTFLNYGVHILQAIQRLKEEGQAAGKEINVELMRLDLASLESTKNFIENFKQKNLPLHMLICNAGVSLVPHGKNHIIFYIRLYLDH